MDHAALREFFEGRLKLNPFVLGREYPYKNIPPRVIAEQFMTCEDGRDIRDYKFLCFDGVPQYMFVISDRHSDCRSDFYDMDFNRLPIVDTYPMSDEPMEKPAFFDEMVALVTKLAQGIRTVRLDLYEINGKLYFGEYTFYDGGGFWPKEPEEWEYKMGDLIRID